VGFRPYVYGLASELRLGGWVCNDPEGVLIEAEGERCSALLDRLVCDRPRTARIDALEVDWVEPRNEQEFSIRESRTAGSPSMTIAADLGVCDDCLRELFDPADRRYGYPFINCIGCGPRYTIAEGLPYDRPRTAMAGFAMCDLCEKEYRDPRDRRFHAQATACPACGPRLSMPVREIAEHLHRGQIVAIKGLGGFHLACDASDETAVARLRRAKDRDRKPFAVMVANVETARTLAALEASEERVLSSPERPILLVQRRSNTLAPSLAPDLSTIGLMLPYTPLHYLIFHELAGRPEGVDWLERRQPFCLVMTSANPGGEPLVIGGEEARSRLATVAEATADHDRPISVRCDDTVLRLIQGAPMPLRRARGMVPDAIALPRAVPPILAVGGDRKVTICVTHGTEAFLSQHIGSPNNAATVEFFEQTVRHLLEILEVAPVAVAHDLHPDFFTTRYAEALGLPVIPVQHHHAHMAAVMAEHGIRDPAIGVVLDGFGLGEDGTSRGGELLLWAGARCHRIGHLRPLRQPGGDRAADEPWRMAAAALHALGRREEIKRRFGGVGPADGLATILDRGVNAPWTSSCGRLFDAAAGLLGVRQVSSFEGEAPMALESLVRRPRVLGDGWRIEEGLTLSLLPLLDALCEADPIDGAELFHGTLIAGLCDWIDRAVAVHGITKVTLSGGCFANKILTEGLMSALAGRGLEVLLPRRAPPNDGGLSLGQAWVAAEVLAADGARAAQTAQPDRAPCA
jgi:hydrogenase maturation protein HypF